MVPYILILYVCFCVLEIGLNLNQIKVTAQTISEYDVYFINSLEII